MMNEEWRIAVPVFPNLLLRLWCVRVETPFKGTAEMRALTF